MTSRYNSISYLLCPSSFKHAAIFFGKGLKTYLKSINYTNISKLNLIDDEVSYIIHNNGYITLYEEILSFISKNDDIAIYYYKSNNKYNYDIMNQVSFYICKYIDIPFSFFKYGVYCFEIIIESYKYFEKNIKFRHIKILFNYFYNSNSISENINFECVYRKYNIHKLK